MFLRTFVVYLLFMSKISYTAVVLDANSSDLLKKEFMKLMPQGWEWIGHHMTITLGALSEPLRSDLVGKKLP